MFVYICLNIHCLQKSISCSWTVCLSFVLPENQFPRQQWKASEVPGFCPWIERVGRGVEIGLKCCGREYWVDNLPLISGIPSLLFNVVKPGGGLRNLPLISTYPLCCLTFFFLSHLRVVERTPGCHFVLHAIFFFLTGFLCESRGTEQYRQDT